MVVFFVPPLAIPLLFCLVLWSDHVPIFVLLRSHFCWESAFFVACVVPSSSWFIPLTAWISKLFPDSDPQDAPGVPLKVTAAMWLKTTEVYYLRVLQTEVCKEVLAQAPSEVLKKDPFLSLVASGSPMCSLAIDPSLWSLPLSSPGGLSVCRSVYIIFPLFIRTPVTWD